MQTQEISRDRWQPFFSDFTQLHQGERINVETIGDGLGVTSRLCDMPLVSISSVPGKLGRGQGADQRIEVIAGGTSERPSSHRIGTPSKVRLAEEEDGKAVALQIESADGSVTMIRFAPPRENMPAGFMV